MKVIWDVVDIRVGRRYAKSTSTEEWLIGYLSYSDDDVRYVSISTVDGLVTPPQTAEVLADLLTKNEMFPVEFLKENSYDS